MNNFKEMIELQAKLDKRISGEDVYSNKEIMEKTRLALLVEIGEYANEVASFKHWKKSHVRNDERVLDETADVMHFVLSLINFINNDGSIQETIDKTDISKYEDIAELTSLDECFFSLYGTTLEGNIGATLHCLISLNRKLGYQDELLVSAYKKKNAENHKRQDNKY